MGLKEDFNQFIPNLASTLTIPNTQDWSVKGFIDYYKNIYSISIDTKVISKIIELMIFPKLLEFANSYNYNLKLSPHQNYYPDITLINKSTNEKYAIDLKSTYRVTDERVNGMTLGAFTGYFRNRSSSKNILFPYNEYKEHFVLGIVYSRTDITQVQEYLKTRKIEKFSKKQRDSIISYINENTDEKWNAINEALKNKTTLSYKDRKIIDTYLINETQIFNLNSFAKIQSVVKNFDLFIQEKWRIAIDRPGSGNTKNIGSEVIVNNLKSGNGLFVREFGKNAKQAFNNYWTTYETKSMAKEVGRDIPLFNNIASYRDWIKSIKNY